MTSKETERLAKVEQKVDDLKETAEDNFNALALKLDAAILRMDNMNKSFITVAHAKLVAWFAGFVISVATIAVLIWSHLTK